jgi:ribonuclease BN (tRNA processing enzyme)
VRLTVVGCSGSFPGPESAASCYLLEHDGFVLVLDLGSGAIGPLQRYVGLDAVDAVLLTHLHADHCADLCGYYVARRYAPGGPAGRPLDVYGPPGTAAAVAGAYGGISDAHLAEVFAFHPIAAGAWELGPFSVRTTRTAHPVECNALRLEAGGRSLTYTGDTGPSDAVRALAAGSDLLLAEASFVEGADNPADLHLTGYEAGRLAADAGVGRLVVTHVPPWHDADAARADAARAYAGPCDLARPGASYAL